MGELVTPSQQKAQARAKKRQQEKKSIREYKELLVELRDVGENDDIDEGNTILEQHITRSRFLFPKIHRRTEAVALDALHTKKLAQIGSGLSNKIVIEQRPFETEDFCKKLIRYVKNIDRSQDIDTNMVKFGCEVSKCFLIAPTFDFMYGAFSQKGLVKKGATRAKKERVRHEEPKSTIMAAEKNFETEIVKDATPKEVERIFKQLQRTVRKNKVDKVDYFSLTVDPTSFARTVENIFHSAFLAKEGKVEIRKGSDNDPKILPVKSSRQSTEGGDNIRGSNHHQTILSFDMKDWKAWINQYEVKSEEVN